MEVGAPTAGEDARLVEAVRAGDTAAFSALFRAHSGPVHRVVASMLSDPATVEDVVQEVFMKALEQLPKLRDPERFRPWLMSIARHGAVDARRQRGRVRLIDEADAEHLPERGEGPDELAELSELAELVNRSVVALSTRDATAVFLVTQLGYSPSEVGEVLGVSPGAAKVIVHRARRRLRDAVVLDVLVRSPTGACSELESLLATNDVVGAGRHVRDCPTCSEAAEREVELYDAEPEGEQPTEK